VGQIEFNQTLREERNLAVRKRLAVNFNLDPLDQKETEKYIDHRLKIAGAAENLFTREAIRDIFYFSGGYPRLINIICDHALLTGYSKDLKRLDDSVIAECRKDLRILVDPDKPGEVDDRFKENQELVAMSKLPDKARGGKRIWMVASFILAFILIGYIIFNFAWRNTTAVEIREKIVSVKKGLSEKESAQSEGVVIKDIDDKKDLKNDQIQASTAQEKSGETEKESALLATQDDTGAADRPSAAEAKLLPPPKTVIQFGHNSMQLSDEAREKLDRIVEFSSANPVSEIMVKGYTDLLGHPVYNKNLSKKRAEVVKKYLMSQGVPEAKIEAVGMGPVNPIASNDTLEGRKRNRRIEVTVNK
jgi:general secretion pathway protein A